MITLERVLALKSSDFFKFAPEEALGELAPFLTEVYFAANDTLIKKGDYGDKMYLIVSGKAHVMMGNQLINEHKAYEVVGELEALSPNYRTSTVVAVEDMLTLAIDNSMLYETIDINPKIAQGIIQAICGRYRVISDQYHDFLHQLNHS